MKLKKKLMSLALVVAMAVCMLPMSGMSKVNAADHDYGTYSAGEWVVDGDTETRTSTWTFTALDENTQMAAGETVNGGIVCQTVKVKYGKDYFTICSGGVAGIPVAEGVTSGTLTLNFTSNKSSGERSLLNASGEVAFTYTAKGNETYNFTAADIVDGYITLESGGTTPGDIKMDSITLVETRPVSSGAGVEDTEEVEDYAYTYVQYKQQDDDKFTLRFVSAIEESALEDINAAGFSLTVAGDTEVITGQNVFKSIYANGEVVNAADGCAFVVVEVKNVPAGTVFTDIKLAVELEDGTPSYDSNSFTYTTPEAGA